MAPPPFKGVGALRKPLTVEETAEKLGVSRRETERIMASLDAVLVKQGSSKTKSSAAARRRPRKAVKATARSGR